MTFVNAFSLASATPRRDTGFMKAAVLHGPDQAPRYEQVSDPVAGAGDEIARVLAASLKNIDRAIASGRHYHAGPAEWPRLVGMDGVVQMEDGSRFYTGGRPGFLAERAVVSRGFAVPVPQGLDPAVAAALPNPGLAAWFALHGKADFKRGETLLVLGATGVSGRLAVAFARDAGAGHIIAAGRNPALLEALPGLGANQAVSLAGSDSDVRAALQEAVSAHHVDLVVDYLWGRPAEMLLDVMGGNDLNAEARRTRYLQVGSMAGRSITLKADILRSAEIEVFGQGGGSVAKNVQEKAPEVLAQLFARALEGQLPLEVEALPLSEVETAWNRDSRGRRVVFRP